MTAGPQLRRLTRRAQFLSAAKGSRAGRTAFTVQVTAVEDTTAGIGLTVTKKVGNAPQRNRIKRRLRAAARACSAAFHAQHDYVLVGRREALTVPFSKMVADLGSALGKLHDGQQAP